MEEAEWRVLGRLTRREGREAVCGDCVMTVWEVTRQAEPWAGAGQTQVSAV